LKQDCARLSAVAKRSPEEIAIAGVSLASPVCHSFIKTHETNAGKFALFESKCVVDGHCGDFAKP
jgi:hypothetical protein